MNRDELDWAIKDWKLLINGVTLIKCTLKFVSCQVFKDKEFLKCIWFEKIEGPFVPSQHTELSFVFLSL